MAKPRTFLYIALGVFLLVVIISAFTFKVHSQSSSSKSPSSSSKSSSVKEGLTTTWKTLKNQDINGNNIIVLPVDVKVDRKTRQKIAFLNVNDKSGITKRFLTDKGLDTKIFNDKPCQLLCDALPNCKSYSIDYTNKTCTLKSSGQKVIPIERTLSIKNPPPPKPVPTPAKPSAATAKPSASQQKK